MALTTRVQRLKREFIDQPKSICAERANLITQSYQETEGCLLYTSPSPRD